MYLERGPVELSTYFGFRPPGLSRYDGAAGLVECWVGDFAELLLPSICSTDCNDLHMDATGKDHV